jgi:hypothetical protein
MDCISAVCDFHRTTYLTERVNISHKELGKARNQRIAAIRVTYSANSLSKLSRDLALRIVCRRLALFVPVGLAFLGTTERSGLLMMDLFTR